MSSRHQSLSVPDSRQLRFRNSLCAISGFSSSAIGLVIRERPRSKAHSFKSDFNLRSGFTVMKSRPHNELKRRLTFDANPASVHTMMFRSLRSKSFMSLSSSGMRLVCSFWFPENKSNPSGTPSPSTNSPIWTIGLGRFSFECPYLRYSSSD